jgi:ketosteroid isomerase-like protein
MQAVSSAEIEDLRQRVGQLEARNEIGELVSAYAIACDEHDMPRLMSLFTEDAEIDSPRGLLKAKGRAAIEELFIGLFRIRGPGYHWTHDRFVEFDARDPDRATGLVLSHAETTPHNEASVAAMRYADEYRRTNGRWLFSRRVLTFLYYVPAKDYLTALNNPQRFTVSGQRQPADFPESLPAWQDFERKYGTTLKG